MFSGLKDLTGRQVTDTSSTGSDETPEATRPERSALLGPGGWSEGRGMLSTPVDTRTVCHPPTAEGQDR